MSWSDDLNNSTFEIITGDKRSWLPLLIQNYEKNIEYSGVQYEFINQIGSLFARRLPKGRSYPLQFAFVGENNVTEANAFELSARDYRAWKIIHPFYGQIQVQPLSLKIVSTQLNSTVITCQVIESGDAKQPISYPTYIDMIEGMALEVLSVSENLASDELLSAQDRQLAVETVSNIGKLIEKAIKLESDYKKYKEALNKALNEIDNAVSLTVRAIKAIQSLLTLPATIAGNIRTRFNMLKEALESIGNTVDGIASGDYFKKIYYNLIGATIVCAMAKTVVTKNEGDFETKTDVLLYVEKLTEEYETYLEKIYSLEDESFIPDHEVALKSHILICQTLSTLYQLMFESKQERIVYLEKDSNLIILAHRLYGLASEENIVKLKNTNKIGLSEILNIKKDREIIYYV